MSATHFVEKCKHGITGAQCRCASHDKEERRIECNSIPDHDKRVREMVANNHPSVKVLDETIQQLRDEIAANIEHYDTMINGALDLRARIIDNMVKVTEP